VNAVASTATLSPSRNQLGLFFVQDYVRIMRGRVALLLWALIFYTLVLVPFIMSGPQQEFVRSLASWLGGEEIGRKLILFVWVDATMNKLAIIVGPVLAGGIIVDEKARGTYDLFLSKPIGAGDYFIVKLAASCAALVTFYLGAVAGALLTFPWRVAGFDAGDFLALSAVHLFAALFSATFAGLVAVISGNRLAGTLVSIVILGLLVGFAFLGFYYPEFRTWSYLNPFFNGIVLIGSLDHYGWIDIVRPILVLVGFNVIVTVIGRWQAIKLVKGEHGRQRRFFCSPLPLLPPVVQKLLILVGREFIRAAAQVNLRPTAKASAFARQEAAEVAESSVPFRRLIAAEWSHAICQRHMAMFLLLAGMGVGVAGWMPLWPETVYRFFARIFHLSGWPEIVLINNFTGFVFCLYWLGIFDVLRIYVVPVEERYIDLLLSKPVKRREFMMAKALPSFLILFVMGTAAAAVHAGAMFFFGLPFDVPAYASAVAVILAFTICLVALANLLVLTARDTFSALVIAFILFMAVMLPGVVYIYRPDFYAFWPGLTDLIVFPANLLWHSAETRRFAPLAVFIFLLISLVLVALAGHRLQQRDITEGP
jgi:ABC-type transport system involved in multi-copper enzyme maturation permease subunit